MYLRGISYYLPEKTLSNEEINKDFPEWSVDKISSKTGIYNRHIAANDETVSDMGVKASQKLFNEWGINKGEIDFIILCTQSPDYFLPTTACILQSKLELSPAIGAIDINMGCSGYVYGLSFAKGLLQSRSASNVLLVTSEAYSKYIHNQDKSNRTIFGDAATATLISSDNINDLGTLKDFVFETDGSGYNSLIVKNGAGKHPSQDGVDVYVDGVFEKNDNNLYMNGKDIFNFTAERVPVLVDNLLKRNHLTKEEIDLFVFHQANKYMMNFMRKKINIDEEKFFVYLENVGNTVSSTIPIALYHANSQGKLKGNILLAGFGVGLSLAGVIIQK